MYDVLKDKLKADSDIFEEVPLPNEKYVISEPDLYYKEESFNSGNTNICFILGHSGSGKSMMARALEGDDIDHIELDDLLLIKDHFTMDELKDYSDLLFDFFQGEAAKRHEDVIDEFNSINACFVNDDADGIRAIIKKAEANTELSNWNKLRIVNECQAALFDLCIEFPGC